MRLQFPTNFLTRDAPADSDIPAAGLPSPAVPPMPRRRALIFSKRLPNSPSSCTFFRGGHAVRMAIVARTSHCSGIVRNGRAVLLRMKIIIP